MADDSELAGERVTAREYAKLANSDRDLIDLVIEAERSNVPLPDVPTARPLSLEDDVEQTVESALDEEQEFLDPWLLFRHTDANEVLDTAEGVCARNNLPTIVYDCEQFEEGGLAGAVRHNSNGEPTWVDGVLTRALYHSVENDIAIILHNVDALPPEARDTIRTFVTADTEYNFLTDRVPGIDPTNLLKMGEGSNIAVIATATDGRLQQDVPVILRQKFTAVDLSR